MDLGDETKHEFWVDELRAVAMLFVVGVHTVNGLPGWKIYNVVVAPIMIPLFFAISGYVFRDRNGNQRVFFKKLFQKRLVPWFVLSLIWLRMFLVPVRGMSYGIEKIGELLSGDMLWYIPACIVAEILFFYILKICGTRYWLIIILAILCTASGFVMSRYGVLDFAMINRGFIAQSYLLIGFLMRMNAPFLQNFNRMRDFLALIAYVLLGVFTIIFWPGEYMDVHLNIYYNIPICLLMIWVGCFFLFSVMRKKHGVCKLLVYIGQNTFVIYALHGYVLRLTRECLVLLPFSVMPTWFLAGMKTVIAVGCCCAVAWIINTYIPWAVGKCGKGDVNRET